MPTQYTELKTLTEIAQAIDAGKYIEKYTRIGRRWIVHHTKDAIYPHLKYRLAEDWHPENGEIVYVPAIDKKSEFRFYDDGIYICRSNGNYIGWDEVKPIPPEKVARQGWVYQEDLHSTSGIGKGFYVREVLGDDDE